ncbi:hypothetical protein [Streptomyces afghaniensis]|uniref:hypothetical protein n=1 Tax=Streptomyces afghaniensis TaxID=66865 RepID=UPI002783A93B|nr:hypothetical protein [Streptomyces afghaniensis]MDQ1015171.1 hypothetical protein [Streptomyces afghaniensis]
MATGGWGPGTGPGQPGGNGPGGQGGWGAPYGPPQGGPYGPPPPNPGPYPYPYPNQPPYPYGPQPSRPTARRRRGCLSFGAPFGLVGAVLRSAHRVAIRLFAQEGEGRIEDRTVDRVQLARTLLGAAATIALVLAYNVDPNRWEDAAYGGAAQLIVAPFVLIIAAPLVITGFIYYAPPHLRPHLRSRLRAPLKAVGWYVLTLVVMGGILVPTALIVDADDGKSWWEYVMAVASLIVIVWGLPFFFMASLYSARSAFNSAQVHPMLPPVLTLTLVWVFAAFSLIGDGMPGGPPIVQFCSTLGGPMSVTAVSLWELRRMRTRFGVTLRA